MSSFLFEVMGLDPNHAFTNPYVADDETGRPTEYCGIRTTGAVGSPCGYPRSMHRPDPRDPDPLHVEATYQDGWEDGYVAGRDGVVPPVLGAILCAVVAGAVGFVVGLATGWWTA